MDVCGHLFIEKKLFVNKCDPLHYAQTWGVKSFHRLSIKCFIFFLAYFPHFVSKQLYLNIIELPCKFYL